MLLLIVILISAANAMTNLPFSWNTVPIFAFPGAHNGFINQTEINKYNLTQFPQLILWGINVSCQANNGTIYPADISGSYYSCGTNHSYYPNLEISLQQQAMELKQMKYISNETIIFAYSMFDAAQQSYLYQSIFNSDQHSNWHLSLTNDGTINCWTSYYHCEAEGPSEFMYDFSQTDVTNYFINNVTMSITNSSFINGLFLDEVDAQYVSCNPNEYSFQWNCTQIEIENISNGIINTLENMFMQYKNKYKTNKVFSISLHSNMFKYGSLYWRIRNVLDTYNDIAIRYYESFSDKNDILTFYNETNYGRDGLSIHAHSYRKTMNPDFVELAAFLIGANNQSWFSYSDGWNVNSNWYQPEYNNKLGKPLNFGNCSMSICKRSFEFCQVIFDISNYSATLNWK